MALHYQHVRERVIKQRGNKCEKCGYKGYVEHHHIVPIKDGGSNNNANILLLCEKCHAETHGCKKRNYIDEYRKSWSG